MCHNLRRFCLDEGIVAVFRVDRKNNIKKAICASLPRWLSSVILLLFTNFVNIHTVDHIFRISVSVSFMPTLPMYPILLIVSSTSSRTIPSPGWKLSVVLAHVMSQNCGINSGCDFCCTGGFFSVADHTADVSDGVDDGQADILLRSARKDGWWKLPAPQPALTLAVSGKATNIFFWWTAIRLLTTSALYSLSWESSILFYKSITGRETVIPWFPLPELMTTGREQPLIRASEPGCCAGTGTDFNVSAIIIQKGAAYLCSVRMIQAFIGNCRVHGDLTVKNVFDIFNFTVSANSRMSLTFSTLYLHIPEVPHVRQSGRALRRPLQCVKSVYGGWQW